MRPNVLFFTCHDLGRHLRTYGQRTVHTPALDRLAADGVVFEQSFCTAPQCSPSRAALHTGRHAHSVGMLGLAHQPFGWRLHADEKHLAAYLADAGYDTALYGVQHVTSTRTVGDLGYKFYDRVNPVVPAPELADKAIAFLEQAREREAPFYLELGFFEPHRPYDWGGAQPDDALGVALPSYLPDAPEARREFAMLQGMIRRVDEAVSRVLAALNDTGQAANTWVIFTTDHGLAMPRAKSTLYDPGLETALLMRWPGGLVGGRRFSEMLSHVDVVPTLLQGLGLPVPDHVHGRSFWPLLCGEPYTPNERIFAEKTFHQAYEPMRGIRTRAHKLIVNFEIDMLFNVPGDVQTGLIYPLVVDQVIGMRPHVELYDLQADPGETFNFAGQPDMAEIEAALKAALVEWMRDTDDPLLRGPVASPYRERALALLRQTDVAPGDSLFGTSAPLLPI